MLSIVIFWLSFTTSSAFTSEVAAVYMGRKKWFNNRDRFVHWFNWAALPIAVVLCVLASIVIAIRPSAMLTHKDVWGTLIATLFLDY